MTIPDEDRDQLAREHFNKGSWDELDVHEKRVCTGKWVGQHRGTDTSSPKASGGKKKK